MYGKFQNFSYVWKSFSHNQSWLPSHSMSHVSTFSSIVKLYLPSHLSKIVLTTFAKFSINMFIDIYILHFSSYLFCFHGNCLIWFINPFDVNIFHCFLLCLAYKLRGSISYTIREVYVESVYYVGVGTLVKGAGTKLTGLWTKQEGWSVSRGRI